MAKPDLIALDILDAVAARLAAIDGGEEYHTNAGARVYRGVYQLSPEQVTLPALGIRLGTVGPPSDNTATLSPGVPRRVERSLTVSGLVVRPSDNADDPRPAYQLEADVLKAMTVEPIQPGAVMIQSASHQVGESSLGSGYWGVEVTYSLTYYQTYGR